LFYICNLLQGQKYLRLMVLWEMKIKETCFLYLFWRYQKTAIPILQVKNEIHYAEKKGSKLRKRNINLKWKNSNKPKISYFYFLDLILFHIDLDKSIRSLVLFLFYVGLKQSPKLTSSKTKHKLILYNNSKRK